MITLTGGVINMSFGKIQSKMEGLLIAIVLVVVILGVLSGSIGNITGSFAGLSSNLSANNVGFANFFTAGGLVYLILGAVILLVVFGLLFALMGRKR